jgi:hypothetical protein
MSKALPWFRFYTEAVNDPKVQRLPPQLFKTWVNLLCLAGQNGGDLPSVDDIAYFLRLSTHDAQQQIDELIFAGLVDIGKGQKLSPHNWENRQFVSDVSTERVRKYRQTKKKETCNADETFQETPPEQNRTDSDTETDNPLPLNDEDGGRGQIQSFDLGGLGQILGRRSVTAEAKRRVAQQLGITDATPLVALYESWKGSKRAKDVDAHFTATAPTLFAKAAAPVKAACGPIAESAPEIVAKPVRPSSQLAALLERKR